jgi:hypothetical protein
MARKLQVPLFDEDAATAMLAKMLASHAFRDPLEIFHGGTSPSSQTGDFSDVMVVTPYGEIPWNDLQRISDEEMKELMIKVVSILFTLLVGLDDKNVQAVASFFAYEAIAKWDAPSIHEPTMELIRHPHGSPKPEVIKSIVSTIMECESERRSKARTVTGR